MLPCYQHALSKCGPSSKEAGLAEFTTAEARAKRDDDGLNRQCDRSAPPQRVKEEMSRVISLGQREPFYVVDVQAALERLAAWREELPEITPHYAVKCNGDPALLLTLAASGVNFDCASEAEIAAVLDLGVSASRIVYANPVKQPSHVEYAAGVGVRLSVFDGAHELPKLAPFAPTLELLLRVAVDDSQAQCVLSNKFGAPAHEAARLLQRASELGLRVVGVSFHVGSGSSSPDPFADAVGRAKAIFELAEAAGAPMHILDVGGGFDGESFGVMCASLRAALATHFPPARHPHLKLIAEPGRFFAAPTHHLAVCVIGKKVSEEGAAATELAEAEPARADGRTMYYVNDGLYGSFNCVLYDHAHVECDVIPQTRSRVSTISAADGDGDGGRASRDAEMTRRETGGEMTTSSVWGPTCDGIDCVLSNVQLPSLEIGSWLHFPQMGAYTRCAGSNFNGMALPDVIYLRATRDEGLRPEAPQAAAVRMIAKLRAEGLSAEAPTRGL